jgi:hypothetical protein
MLNFDLGGRGRLSDCNSLSGLNPLINRILNKKVNTLIYIFLSNKKISEWVGEGTNYRQHYRKVLFFKIQKGSP